LKENWQYFQKMILVTQRDETERWEGRHYLDDRLVGTSEGVFYNMKSISPTTVIVPNIVHSGYHTMLKHSLEWETSFLEQYSRIDKINQHLAMMI